MGSTQWDSTAAWTDYGSTSSFSTEALGAASSGYQHQQRLYEQQQQYQRELLRQQRQQPYRQTAPAAIKQEPKKGFSMVEEVRSYVREYKDWIFTIAIIAIVDHFFLDGALKEKLAGALGKKLDNADGKA